MFGIDIYKMIVSKMLKLTLTRILHMISFEFLHDFVTKTIKINNSVTFVEIFSAVILRKKTFMLLVF